MGKWDGLDLSRTITPYVLAEPSSVFFLEEDGTRMHISVDGKTSETINLETAEFTPDYEANTLRVVDSWVNQEFTEVRNLKKIMKYVEKYPVRLQELAERQRKADEQWERERPEREAKAKAEREAKQRQTEENIRKIRERGGAKMSLGMIFDTYSRKMKTVPASDLDKEIEEFRRQYREAGADSMKIETDEKNMRRVHAAFQKVKNRK